MFITFIVEGNNWHNSVSSALSSNDRIFASGVAIKGAPGWWALHHWEPPAPPRKLLNLKRSYEMVVETDDQDQEITLSCSEGESQDEKPLNILESETDQYEDLIVDESEDTEEDAVKEDKDADGDNNNSVAGDNNDSAAGPLQPSADLKQQLLERLLMMDSSLLHDAIKKAKAKKLAEVENATFSGSVSKRQKNANKQESETVDLDTQPTTTENQECLNAIQPFYESIKARLSAIPVIRASPYENDLLKKCNRIDYPEIKVGARLRRKLLLRRQRRKMELGLFDLDQWMYLFLKSPESALFIDKARTDIVMSEDTLYHNTPTSSTTALDLSQNFDPQSIPYIQDPSKSLYVKLTGMAALYGTCPFPVVSPFTGKLLPEAIEEEECEAASEKFPKIKLLNQIRRSNHENLEPLTLKYTHLRKEFVGQLNDLLSDSFWPGIDVSEALEYPDYAIIALVGLSVVGCAICNPEGYLSYLYVRPDFQGRDLAKKLLALLLPTLSKSKDLTLHVSVSNAPAMLLYQQIGFKPEEFIVNFYDKYLGVADSGINTNISNKNAFFMRLRR